MRASQLYTYCAPRFATVCVDAAKETAPDATPKMAQASKASPAAADKPGAKEASPARGRTIKSPAASDVMPPVRPAPPAASRESEPPVAAAKGQQRELDDDEMDIVVTKPMAKPPARVAQQALLVAEGDSDSDDAAGSMSVAEMRAKAAAASAAATQPGNDADGGRAAAAATAAPSAVSQPPPRRTAPPPPPRGAAVDPASFFGSGGADKNRGAAVDPASFFSSGGADKNRAAGATSAATATAQTSSAPKVAVNTAARDTDVVVVDGAHSAGEQQRVTADCGAGAVTAAASALLAEVEEMSAGALKRFLSARSIDASHCIEKSELLALARAAIASPRAAVPAVVTTVTIDDDGEAASDSDDVEYKPIAVQRSMATKPVASAPKSTNRTSSEPIKVEFVRNKQTVSSNTDGGAAGATGSASKKRRMEAAMPDTASPGVAAAVPQSSARLVLFGTETVLPPVGSPNCLADTVWVQTGDLPHFNRDHINAIIEKHGGRVTSEWVGLCGGWLVSTSIACFTPHPSYTSSPPIGAVSGKTTHLLTGERLEDGRPVTAGTKYAEALKQTSIREALPATTVKLRTPIVILDEAGFCAMMDATLSPDERTRRAALVASNAAKAFEIRAAVTAQESQQAAALQGGSNTVSAAASASCAAPSLSAVAAAATAAPASSGLSTARPPTSAPLWVDKYAPRRVVDYVGNAKEVSALNEWLRNWDAIHVLKTATGPKWTRDNPGAKAVLISGPPGIGKTTIAHLLGRMYGYDVLELNASDARSKKLINEALGGVTNNTVLSSYFQRADGGGAGGVGAAAAVGTSASHHGGVRRLIIMDEVDGMSSSDRGGNQELIKFIKVTQTPIVCICNDRQKASIRSLANYCFDLKFHPPPTSQLVDRMVQIARQEKFDVEPGAVAQLVESCGGDIRQIINTLQMWSMQAARTLSSAQTGARLGTVSKDALLRLDGFSAVAKLFAPESAMLSVADRSDLFMVDYDMIPLLAQQQYVSSIEKSVGGDQLSRMLRCSRAADAISEADIYSDMLRIRQAWGMLPDIAAAFVRACSHSLGGSSFVPFPTWLGKNSTRGKRLRLLAQTSVRISGKVSCGREAYRLDYHDPLRAALFNPLLGSKALTDTASAVDSVIAILDEYGLSREDMMETMTEVSFPPESGVGVDFLKIVDSKVKAQLTRE